MFKTFSSRGQPKELSVVITVNQTIPSHTHPTSINHHPKAGGIKAQLDVFVGKAGLRLVKTDGKVLGAFPLQRIQQWGIPSPGTFKLSVLNGEKVVGLVIHGDPDEVTAIIECLERKVAQIIEDVRAEEEGREPMDVSSPPPRGGPRPSESDEETEPEEEVEDEEVPEALERGDTEDEVADARGPTLPVSMAEAEPPMTPRGAGRLAPLSSSSPVGASRLPPLSSPLKSNTAGATAASLPVAAAAVAAAAVAEILRFGG